MGRAKSGDERAAIDRFVYTPDVTAQKYAPFKFDIAGENGRRPGYVTEKIAYAMLAHAIPIYLGAPDISEHFKPGSFIDAGAMSPEAVLEEVRRLDADDEAYRAMLMRPWLRGDALRIGLTSSGRRTCRGGGCMACWKGSRAPARGLACETVAHTIGLFCVRVNRRHS